MQHTRVMRYRQVFLASSARAIVLFQSGNTAMYLREPALNEVAAHFLREIDASIRGVLLYSDEK